MSERLTDDQVAWYAGTSRTAKWTADMAVHENIVTLAREVQAHRSSCECAPMAEYPQQRVHKKSQQLAVAQRADQVERLLAKLEIPRNGFRLLDVSISPVESHQTGRSVTFVLNERYTVNFHAPTLLEALRMADQAIWEAGCSATLLTPTDDTYEDSDPEC